MSWQIRRRRSFSAQTDDNGQCNDTQDIVNDSRAQDSVSGTGIESTQFFQGFNGDADRSCSQNNADENILPEQRCHFRILIHIKGICQEEAAHQRYNNTQQGDDKGGKPCFFSS